MFQSTPSRGGRRTTCNILPGYMRFNPRPHAEGDLRDRARKHTASVSIHALTRRATQIKQSQLAVNRVSIHALTRRATCEIGRGNIQQAFQSTPSRGGRRFHAVARRRPNWFQSTPSRGGRLASFCSSFSFSPFQSTPSRGGRQTH